MMDKDDDAAVFNILNYLSTMCSNESVRRPGDQPQPAVVISERNTNDTKSFFFCLTGKKIKTTFKTTS